MYLIKNKKEERGNKMASELSYVQYVVDTLRENNITYKRMFGEFGLYEDGVFFGLICDNQLFIKISEEGKAFLQEYTLAPPYNGAKEIFLIENVEDYQKVGELIHLTCEVLKKTSKPKRKKRNETNTK